VIPISQRQKILTDLHAEHRGIVGVKARARLSVYWPNIDAQIEQVCRSCEQCQYDRPSQSCEPQLHYPVPDRCFQHVSVDFADLHEKKFMVTTDWRSGWFTCIPMRQTTTNAVIHQLRLQFVDTAVPNVLFTDNGPPFNSGEFQDFCRRWGIRHVTSSVQYPQSNSFAENGV